MLRNKPVRCLPLLAVIASAMCSSVRGQPTFTAVESLEWMSADSNVVVRATITQSTRRPAEADYVWETVTVKVLETLKGTHRPTLKVVVKSHVLDQAPAQWKQQQRELMLFLVDSKRLGGKQPEYARHELALRPHVYWKSSCVELNEKAKSKLFTLDLSSPTDPQQVLRQTRAAVAAARQDKPLPAHVVRWVGPPGSSWHGGYVDVTVPVDRRLQQQARRWVKAKRDNWKELGLSKQGIKAPGHYGRNSKEVLLCVRPAVPDARRTVSPWLKAKAGAWHAQWLRYEGAKALGQFRSNANIAVLKGLLEDPGFWIQYDPKGDRKNDRVRVYCVRMAAYAALQKWGIEVERPVVRELLPTRST